MAIPSRKRKSVYEEVREHHDERRRYCGRLGRLCRVGVSGAVVLNKLVALVRNWRDVAWASGVAATIVGAGAVALFVLGAVVVGGVLALRI